jgi:hypothetical protein
MDAALREQVRERAGNRCKYCQLHQEDEPFVTFPIEHIIAKQHGGTDHPSNLALACHHDNLHKGPNLTGVDPKTGKVVRLFHPRRHNWDRHFRWDGPDYSWKNANRPSHGCSGGNEPPRTHPVAADTHRGGSISTLMSHRMRKHQARLRAAAS